MLLKGSFLKTKIPKNRKVDSKERRKELRAGVSKNHEDITKTL